MDKDSLLKRLDAIADSLRLSGHGLALLALGSCGLERDRLDEFSDLDFFAIVEPGSKPEYLASLNWLERVCPVEYRFRNTRDGYKALFQDGVFCEFAVFEPAELEPIPFAEGLIVWRAPGFDEALCRPRKPAAASQPSPAEYLLGEALTNLYVGLGRWRRGEKLSGARLVQQCAVDRLLELAHGLERGQSAIPADPFSPERRFESRFPQFASRLPAFIQGYERTLESAQAILEFLESNFDVNPFIRSKIAALCR